MVSGRNRIIKIRAIKEKAPRNQKIDRQPIKKVRIPPIVGLTNVNVKAVINN
jgi:hypothetical protein